MSVHRVAAAAGFVCAVLLVVNSARRAGLLPETALTHAIAPFAALAGLLAITGIYLLIRGTTGVLGLLGYVLNSAGLAGAFAIEYTLHFVFPYLGGGTVSGLLAAWDRAGVPDHVDRPAGGGADVQRGCGQEWDDAGGFGAAVRRGHGARGAAECGAAAGLSRGLVIAGIGVAWMATRLWSAEGVDGDVVVSSRRPVRPTG